MENEPDREWNKKMPGLIREILHYRNNLGNKELDALIVGEFEKRYDDILDLGDREYLDVPPNNSLCERLARVYKRKQKQAMAFRSFHNLMRLCDSMSIVYLPRQKGGNTYEEISDTYRRKRMRPKQTKNNADGTSAASD